MLFYLLLKPMSKLCFKFLDTGFHQKNWFTDKLSDVIIGIIIGWPLVIDFVIWYLLSRLIN